MDDAALDTAPPGYRAHMRLLEGLLNLVAPASCPACGANADPAWCAPCLRALGDAALEDRGLVDLADGVRAAAAYRYEGVVRDTVLAVKVRGQHAVLAAMGSLLRARLGLGSPGGTVATTWVPASRTGRRRRGIDVAQRLAGRSAVRLLRRVHHTSEQKHLDAAARHAAMQQAFTVTRRPPPAVIVIDDVRTTGATATAAGIALREAGARRILVATFAAVQDERLRPAGRGATGG